MVDHVRGNRFDEKEKDHMTQERIYTDQWRDPCPVELRSSKSGRMIGGYALKFNRLSQNLGGYIERIAPSFTNQSRADGFAGVVCRYNHSDELLLGTTSSGTLQCSVDDTGLLYEVDCPECRSDVLEMVSRKDVAYSSFAFEVHEQEWGTTADNVPQRTLISGRIIDVAPVSSPAYRDTSVAMRTLADRMSAPYEDVIAMAKADDLRKLFIRSDRPGSPREPVAIRSLSGATALAQTKTKKAKPMSGVSAKMILLGKRHPRVVSA
jgi:HK97 family phage prohead protease